VKLTKNKHKKKHPDYSRISRLRRVGYSIGADIVSGLVTSPLRYYGAKSISTLPSELLERNISRSQLASSANTIKGYLKIRKSLGSTARFIPMMLFPDSKMSEYAPLIGTLASLPLASELIITSPRKIPAALAITAHSALVPYVTRKIKQYLYEKELKKLKRKK
jgi:hypothetical protein